MCFQGMSTAAERAGVDGDGAVSDHDPDLVAYWKFDEGQGFLVKDSTGRGHDLYLTGEPRWQVNTSTYITLKCTPAPCLTGGVGDPKSRD